LVLALVAFDVRFVQPRRSPPLAASGPRRLRIAAGIPLRRTSDNTTGDKAGDAANDAGLGNKETPAPSRIGNIPTYGRPAPAAASLPATTRSIARARGQILSGPGQAKPPPGPAAVRRWF